MSEYQEKAKECKCCTKHVPLPTSFKNYEGIVMCPTTYYNVVEYKRIWNTYGSRPAGNIRKHFSEYVQGIVEQGMSSDSN
jgi:hypothetical protein